MMKKVLIAVLCIFFYLYGFTQTESETGLRADGKIYVVLAVVTTILAGLIIYLIRIDRKVTKMENNWKRNT